MSVLQAKAALIANDLTVVPELGSDAATPSWLTFLLQLLQLLLPMLISCIPVATPKAVGDALRNLTSGRRLRMRIAARKHINDAEGETYLLGPLVASLNKVAASFNDDEVAMQLHVPASQHVNNHEFCLHWWRPLDAVIPLPDPITVGIASLGLLNADTARQARQQVDRMVAAKLAR